MIQDVLRSLPKFCHFQISSYSESVHTKVKALQFITDENVPKTQLCEFQFYQEPDAVDKRAL